MALLCVVVRYIDILHMWICLCCLHGFLALSLIRSHKCLTCTAGLSASCSPTQYDTQLRLSFSARNTSQLLVVLFCRALVSFDWLGGLSLTGILCTPLLRPAGGDAKTTTRKSKG